MERNDLERKESETIMRKVLLTLTLLALPALSFAAGSSAREGTLDHNKNGSGTTNFNSSGTVTVPNATDTLVGKATTDTLTNKTMAFASNTWTGTLPAANLPNPAVASLGGTFSITCASHQFLNLISTGGAPACSQAAFTDISGTAQIAQGGTAVTSVTTAPTASSFAGWDANSNLSANSHINGYRTTATAAGTTTLVVGDARTQYFTGVTTQTVKLPVTSTLVAGQDYKIVNLSSGVVTLQSSGANTVQAMAANTQLVAEVISTSGTGTASWNWSYGAVQAGLGGTGTVTSLTFTGDGTVLSSTPSSAVTTSGTVNASLINQSATKVFAGPASGSAAAPTFRSLLTTDLPFVISASKTGNYTLAVTDDIVRGDASGGAFTFTLPTAVGVAGKAYRIIRTDLTLANTITLNTTSAQTINGASSKTLSTQYEEWEVVSDGSNWLVLTHKYPSIWTSYTPSFTGFGTATSISGYSRRVGDGLQVKVSFVSGTATATQARISLGYGGVDSNVTVDTAKINNGAFIGMMDTSGFGATTFFWSVLSPTSSVSYINMGVQSSTVSGLTAANASAMTGNGQTVSLYFDVPISNWTD